MMSVINRLSKTTPLIGLIWLLNGCTINPSSATSSVPTQPPQPLAGVGPNPEQPCEPACPTGTSPNPGNQGIKPLPWSPGVAIGLQMGMKLTGKPLTAQQTNNLASNNPETRADAVSFLISEVVRKDGQIDPGFAQRLTAMFRDMFRLRIPRNTGFCRPGQGSCEYAWWRMSRQIRTFADANEHIAAVNRFEQDYFARYPKRLHYWTQDTSPLGGDDFDTPPIHHNYITEPLYYLFEMEPAMLATALVSHDISMEQLLRGNYVIASEALNAARVIFGEEYMSDPTMAFDQPLDPATLKAGLPIPHWSGDWYLVRRSNGVPKPEGGILTAQAALNTYTNPRSWVNRFIYQGFFCEEITGAPNPQNIPFSFLKANDTNPLAIDACTNCHNVLDSLANLRFDYSYAYQRISNASYVFSMSMEQFFSGSDDFLTAFNAYQNTVFSQYPITHYVLNGTNDGYIPVRDMNELGLVIAGHPKFHQCLAKRVFKHFVNREPTAEDRPLLDRGVAAYLQNGERLLPMIATILSGESTN